MIEFIVVGFILGWLIAILYLGHVVRKTVNKLDLLQTTRAKEVSVPILYLETHNNIVYAYQDQEKFIAQAGSIQELIADVTKRLHMEKVVLHTGSELLIIYNGDILKRMDPRRVIDLKSHGVVND